MGQVKVNPEILEWAIAQSGWSTDDLVQRNPKLKSWLTGSSYPTFKQLKSLSKLLKVPFGSLFLRNKPDRHDVSAEFRTINQKLEATFSKDLRDTLLEMDRKKSWMSDYYKANNFNELNLDVSISYDDSPFDAAYKLRSFLTFDLFWQKNLKTKYEAFKLIRESIESKGVLVMMNGIVGTNTHRVLDVSEFRAFVLNDRYAPLIFINRNDTESGMVFSIIHEIFHIILDRENDDVLIEDNLINLERKINLFTAEFLVPSSLLKDLFNPTENIYTEVDRLADLFKVSSTVIAIKLYKLESINQKTLNEIRRDAVNGFLMTRSQRERKSDGGNFYTTQASRMSRHFYNTVIHQAESGNIAYTEAYRLLNLKGKTYDSFKSYVSNKLYE